MTKDKSEIMVVRVLPKVKARWDWDQKKEQLNLRLHLKMSLNSVSKKISC